MKANNSLQGASPVLQEPQCGPEIALICEDPVILKEMSVRFRSLGRITEFDGFANGRPAQHALTDLIISCATRENSVDQHRQARALALSSSAQWLAATLLNERYLVIHGLLHAESAPCVECVLRCIRDQFASHTEPPSREQLAGSRGRAVALTALLLNHVVTNLSLSCPAVRNAVPGSPIRLYDMDEMSSMIPLAGRVPGCEHCWPSPQRSKLRVHLGALYEESSRNQVNVPGSEIVFTPDIQVPRRNVRWETADEIALPAQSVLHQQRHHCYQRGLNALSMANLLFLSFGKWDTVLHAKEDRVLPSSGNLGSAKCYLILCNIHAVPSGTYVYEEDKHVLSHIGHVSEPLLFELLMADAIPTTPCAWFIVVGQFGRIGKKYGPFGYRLAHFDCGIASSQLQALFKMSGFSAKELAAWPEELLARCLGLSMSGDAIMSVFMLGASITTQRLDVPSHNAAFPQVSASGADSPTIDVWTLVDRLNMRSREHIARQWNSSRGSTFLPTSQGPYDIRRRSPYTSEDDMWSELLTRRSVRSFSTEQIAKDTLSDMMGEISGILPGRAHLTICATIQSAAGPDQEFRTYEIKDTGWSLISTLGKRAGIAEVFIDPHAALAPVVLWFCGDVRGAPLEYRRMLIDIGRTAHDAWRAVTRCGMSGYYVGGFRPSVAAQRLGLRFCTQAPILAFACGIATSKANL